MVFTGVLEPPSDTVPPTLPLTLPDMVMPPMRKIDPVGVKLGIVTLPLATGGVATETPPDRAPVDPTERAQSLLSEKKVPLGFPVNP